MSVNSLPADAWPIKRYVDVVLVRPAQAGEQLATYRSFGDSLTSEGINDGDLLVFRMTREARPGQLVIAVTPNGLSIKRYTTDGQGSIWLESAAQNEWWDAEQVTIQGVVIQSIREHL